jgi:hypothetical protein
MRAMNRTLLGIVVGLAIALGTGACNKSPSSDAAKADGGGAPVVSGTVSTIERDAREAAIGELGKHWAKGPDGWTTAITSGSPYAPDHYLREFRDLTVHSVEPTQLDESDRMNGLEWAGQIWFDKTPYREAGDAGLVADGMVGLNVRRQPGRWSQWVDFQPEALRLQKVKGKWEIKQDTFLLRGRLPQPQDLANAGIH